MIASVIVSELFSSKSEGYEMVSIIRCKTVGAFESCKSVMFIKRWYLSLLAVCLTCQKRRVQ